MENRQLSYFIAVAEELSYGKAAKRLHVTQPAVSRQVKLLEEELKVTFFDEEQKRGHKRIVLTEEGVYFYKEALKILQLQADSLSGLERLRTRKKVLTVGTCPSLPGEALRMALRLIKNRLPEFEVRLREYETDASLLEGLNQDEVTMVAGLLTEEVKGDRVQVVLEEGHYVACFPCADERWEGEELAIVAVGEERWLSLKGVNVFGKKVQEVGNIEQVKVLIEEGFGIGILPSFFIAGRKVLPQELCRWGLLMKPSRTGSLYERLN